MIYWWPLKANFPWGFLADKHSDYFVLLSVLVGKFESNRLFINMITHVICLKLTSWASLCQFPNKGQAPPLRHACVMAHFYDSPLFGYRSIRGGTRAIIFQIVFLALAFQSSRLHLAHFLSAAVQWSHLWLLRTLSKIENHFGALKSVFRLS